MMTARTRRPRSAEDDRVVAVRQHRQQIHPLQASLKNQHQPALAACTNSPILLRAAEVVPRYSTVGCGTSTNPGVFTQRMLPLASPPGTLQTQENVGVRSVFRDCSA